MNKKSIKNILLSGGTVQYKKAYIGAMSTRYYENKEKRGGWQVHIEDRKIEPIEESKKIPKSERGFVYRNVYSKILFDIDEAIDKFLGFLKVVYEV